MRSSAAVKATETADRPGRWASAYHAPVMVAEVIPLFHERHLVLDGTLGGGGHSAALLSAGHEVVALDRDADAVATACDRLAEYSAAGAFRAYVTNYAELSGVPQLSASRFDGVLLDLGVSSHQLDDAQRGFSFRAGAPLDMRMGNDVARTAADVLNDTDERELMRIFREYADEPRASRLAREIVRRRANRPFQTSDDLVGAIRAVLGPRSGPSEFARLFQAIRIEVNDEIAALARALPDLRDRLTAGGVIAVIAYHSAEDRVVKQSFRNWSTGCVCPPRLPQCVCGSEPLGELVTRRALTASPQEIEHNKRARSARLRAWRKAA